MRRLPVGGRFAGYTIVEVVVSMALVSVTLLTGFAGLDRLRAPAGHGASAAWLDDTGAALRQNSPDAVTRRRVSRIPDLYEVTLVDSVGRPSTHLIYVPR